MPFFCPLKPRCLDFVHLKEDLASKLTQFIGLTRVFSNPEIKESEIVCYNMEDYQLIKEYLIPADGSKGRA